MENQDLAEDKDRQLKHLWAETKIGNILQWDELEAEEEKLLEEDKASRFRVSSDNHVDTGLEDDKEIDGDETDPYNEVISGRRRPDSVAVDWANKVVYVLEFN